MATIAIDFDNTYTADEALWNLFVQAAIARGHRVICVTARRDTDENREIVQIPGCMTYFTGLSSKLWYMTEKRGVKVDIWIDDDPRSLVNGR
jgi:hypothetical protein